MSMINVANLYNDQGKYAQAEALASQTLEILRACWVLSILLR